MKLSWEARPTASLFAQLLALIGLSLIAANTITLWLLFNLPPPAPDFYRVAEVVQTLRGAPPDVGARLPLLLKTSDEAPGPPSMSRAAPAIRTELALEMGVPERDVVVASTSVFPLSDRRVVRQLRTQMERVGGPKEDRFLVNPFEVGVRRADGRWDVVGAKAPFGLNAWQRRAALWYVLTVLAMAPIAYLFARRLSRPIRQFAEAAERLGRDPQSPPLELKGSAEIGIAVRAFNEMEARLRRYVQDRTTMMGAIAHDLRTPLTRLRFRIESAPEDVRVKMAADIDQMEEMISAALTFVRDASRGGERIRLELSSLLESLCEDMAETGLDTQVERSEKVVLNGDPIALRRLFTNLLENAVKFGGGARARVFKASCGAVVEIDDDGPGIPPEDAERVFEPFFRREPSRSRQTGGAGLGLAVVRSVARGHGGDVALINRPGGGLTVRVQLPI